jgi:3-deoxy-D-manno-octulosonic-acid transferase
VSHYFVQDQKTQQLLLESGIARSTIAGDTRFDRVLEITRSASEVSEIGEWSKGSRILIGGSTWPVDERVLEAWWKDAPSEWKLLIVPHEIEKGHIQAMQRLWPEAVLWSDRMSANWSSSRVVIVDEIGKLSSMYRYATIAWIGGGFGAGIHNTLEAAAWSLPVVFGPRYEKFAEAKGLIDSGAALAARDEEEAIHLLVRLTSTSTDIAQMGSAAGAFVEEGCGATDKIMSFLRSS